MTEGITCLAERTLNCKTVHVQNIQGHVYSGRESLTVSPSQTTSSCRAIHCGLPAMEGSLLAMLVQSWEVDEWPLRGHLYGDTRHRLQTEFGKNVPVVSEASVEQPAGLTNIAVDFWQQ
jgi:hypothetical protein